MEGIFNNPSQQLGDERQGLRSRRLRLLGYAPSQAAFLATTNVDIGQVERLNLLAGMADEGAQTDDTK